MRMDIVHAEILRLSKLAECARQTSTLLASHIKDKGGADRMTARLVEATWSDVNGLCNYIGFLRSFLVDHDPIEPL